MKYVQLQPKQTNFLIFLIASIYLLGMAFLGERMSVNDGLGGDGALWASFSAHPENAFNKSHGAHYVQRTGPSLTVSLALEILNIDKSRENIILTFRIMNALFIIWSLWFFLKIMRNLSASSHSTILAASFIFINWLVLKYSTYSSVAVDWYAFFFSLAMIYYYLNQNIYKLLLCTVLVGWAWPTGMLQGVILLALPRTTRLVMPIEWKKTFTVIMHFVMAFILIYFLIKTVNFPHPKGTAPKNDQYAILSCFVIYTVIILSFHSFMNEFFQVGKFNESKLISIRGVLLGIALFIGQKLILSATATPIGSLDFALHMYEGFFYYATIEPAKFVVAHFMNFGIAGLLIYFYVRRIFYQANHLGLGLGLACFFAYFSSVDTDSRHLLHNMPLLFILLACSLKPKPLWLLVLTVVFQFLLSKSYIPFSLNESSDWSNLLEWPAQAYMMHGGPWMNRVSYQWYGRIAMWTLFLLFVLKLLLRQRTESE